MLHLVEQVDPRVDVVLVDEPEHEPVRRGAQGDDRGGDGHQEDCRHVGGLLFFEGADGGLQDPVALDDGRTWGRYSGYLPSGHLPVT
jgi:hypothetical protein